MYRPISLQSEHIVRLVSLDQNCSIGQARIHLSEVEYFDDFRQFVLYMNDELESLFFELLPEDWAILRDVKSIINDMTQVQRLQFRISQILQIKPGQVFTACNIIDVLRSGAEPTFESILLVLADKFNFVDRPSMRSDEPLVEGFRRSIQLNFSRTGLYKEFQTFIDF